MNKTTYHSLKIKIGGRWVDCLIIGEANDGFFAVNIKDVPKSSLKMFKLQSNFTPKTLKVKKIGENK